MMETIIHAVNGPRTATQRLSRDKVCINAEFAQTSVKTNKIAKVIWHLRNIFSHVFKLFYYPEL